MDSGEEAMPGFLAVPVEAPDDRVENNKNSSNNSSNNNNSHNNENQLNGDELITPMSQGIYSDQENRIGSLVHLTQGFESPGHESPMPSAPEDHFYQTQNSHSNYPNQLPDGPQHVQNPNVPSPLSLHSFLENGGLEEYDMHRGHARSVFRYESPFALSSAYPEAPLLEGFIDYQEDQEENAYQDEYTSVGLAHGNNHLNSVDPSMGMYPAGAPFPYVADDESQPGESEPFEHCYYSSGDDECSEYDDSQPDYTMPPAARAEDGSDAKKKIPLVCTVCPSKPQFSDNSHLLTHINSKGHLHVHQQLKIRALQDQSASDILAEYQGWYNEYDVETLLSQRLAQRDLKEATKKRRASAQGTRPEKKLKNVKKTKTAKAEEAAKQEPLVKAEKGVKMEEGSEPQKKILDIQQRPQTPMSFASGEANIGYRTPVQNHYDGLMSYEDAAPRPKANASGKDSAVEGSYIGSKDVRDNVKLKGAFWPGMSLFDAASPEMKRMRNQRKNSTLVDQMKAASEAVLPNESVFNLEFQLERNRSVYDSPSVDESMTPKKPPKKRGRKPASSAIVEATEAIEEDEEIEETERTASDAQVQVKFEPGVPTGPVTRSRATTGVEDFNDGKDSKSSRLSPLSHHEHNRPKSTRPKHHLSSFQDHIPHHSTPLREAHQY